MKLKQNDRARSKHSGRNEHTTLNAVRASTLHIRTRLLTSTIQEARELRAKKLLELKLHEQTTCPTCNTPATGQLSGGDIDFDCPSCQHAWFERPASKKG